MARAAEDRDKGRESRRLWCPYSEHGAPPCLPTAAAMRETSAGVREQWAEQWASEGAKLSWLSPSSASNDEASTKIGQRCSK